MARTTKPLTNTEVKQAKAKEKVYKLSDGGGLQLRVRPNGSKSWQFDYYTPFTKKRVTLAFGMYPSLSLSEARKMRDEAKTLLVQNIDPRENKKAVARQQQDLHINTLVNVARKWLDIKKTQVTVDHANDIWRSLELHIFPTLGNHPVSNLNAPETIEVISVIAAKGSLETVRRVIQRLNEVMTYAVNTGAIHANPLSGIKAAFETPSKRHMPSIKPEELPELMMCLNRASIKLTTRCVIEWQLHTMTRPSEAAGTRWEEIDLAKRIWTIPAERMKNRKEHQIPLSTHAINILELMMPISSKRDHVFPSDKNPKAHIHEYTANMALKRMGFKSRLVAHGLRALASTTLNEQNFNKDIIEAALAHVDKNQVRDAYNHAQYIEQRKVMMQWWSDFISSASAGSVSISGHKHLGVAR